MMSVETVRQGDILFILRADAKVPEQATHIADGVIARGASTGHTHRLRESELDRLVRSTGGVMFVVVQSATAHIDHQEHATAILVRGTWEIRRQREETPEGLRRVED